MEVQDEVRLLASKNDDFKSGEILTLKGISTRQPNVLHLVNEEGLSTFVDYYDAKLETIRGLRDGTDVLDMPINNRYLLWP
jgi:hypothetical protein